MAKRPTMSDAEQAAELLGLNVYELGRWLRAGSESAFEACASEVRRDGRPESCGRARRFLAAAEACENAWDEVTAARVAGIAPETKGSDS